MLFNDKLIELLNIAAKILKKSAEEVAPEVSDLLKFCQTKVSVDEFDAREFESLSDKCYKKLLELSDGGYLYFPNKVQRAHFLGLYLNRVDVIKKCKYICEDYNKCIGSPKNLINFNKIYAPAAAGVINAKERSKNLSLAPQFELKSDGEYLAIKVKDNVYAFVPRFGYRVGNNFYGPLALSVLFECENYKAGLVFNKVVLKRVAIFQSDKGWKFVEKGKLNLGLGIATTPKPLKPAIIEKPKSLQVKIISPLTNSVHLIGTPIKNLHAEAFGPGADEINSDKVEHIIFEWFVLQGDQSHFLGNKRLTTQSYYYLGSKLKPGDALLRCCLANTTTKNIIAHTQIPIQLQLPGLITGAEVIIKRPAPNSTCFIEHEIILEGEAIGNKADEINEGKIEHLIFQWWLIQDDFSQPISNLKSSGYLYYIINPKLKPGKAFLRFYLVDESIHKYISYKEIQIQLQIFDTKILNSLQIKIKSPSEGSVHIIGFYIKNLIVTAIDFSGNEVCLEGVKDLDFIWHLQQEDSHDYIGAGGHSKKSTYRIVGKEPGSATLRCVLRDLTNKQSLASDEIQIQLKLPEPITGVKVKIKNPHKNSIHKIGDMIKNLEAEAIGKKAREINSGEIENIAFKWRLVQEDKDYSIGFSRITEISLYPIPNNFKTGQAILRCELKDISISKIIDYDEIPVELKL